MADRTDKIEDVAAKAEGPADSTGTNALKSGRYSTRWVRVCVTKSLASPAESELTSRRSTADKKPWRRTRRRG